MTSCFDNYITASEDTVSKSGLYFTDLSACTVSLLDDLTKEDHADWTDCFDYLYRTAQRNLKIDVQRKLADKFHIDKKLITRETSEFLTPYTSGLSGVKIWVTLPKYARLQIVSIELDSLAAHTAGQILVYQEDENGRLLSTITENITGGRQVIQMNQLQEFEERHIYIATSMQVRTTKNKWYADNSYNGVVNGLNYDDKFCSWSCWYGGTGSVFQINGGGLNVKFILFCSMEKFICENLPLFQYAILNRLGVDTMKERITTQKVNKTSVLTEDRAKELMEVFNEDYKAALDAATSNLKMTEDPICFMCKASIHAKTNLP